MGRFYKLTWQEPLAYFVSAASLLMGAWFAGKGIADAIASAGAVTVVCGVLLASSRKIDALHTKTINFINSRRESERLSIKEMMTSSKGTAPSDEEVNEVLETVLKDSAGIIAELIDKRRRAFKIHELILVIVGTLINGFGPFIAKGVLKLVS
ncbi:hypothetical protein GCM10025794_01160 [Massilia kyonggiensis]|nr:hypothetical protein [Massilia kyonggiensis]